MPYLRDRCPKCKSSLFTFYHEYCYGDPCTGVWFVECCICDYKPEENTFSDLEKVYNIFQKLTKN